MGSQGDQKTQNKAKLLSACRKLKALKLWTCCALAPKHLRVAVIELVHICIQKHSECTNTNNNYCAQHFFLLLAIPVHVDIRGGEKPPDCFLSRTHCLLIYYSKNVMVDCLIPPLAPDHSLAKSKTTAQLGAKIILLHWAHLVGRGLKKCSFTMRPVQQVTWLGNL